MKKRFSFLSFMVALLLVQCAAPDATTGVPSLSSSDMSFTAAAQNRIVNLTAFSSWRASLPVDCDWISLSSSGGGAVTDFPITVTVTANTGATRRQGIISIVSGQTTLKLTITQAGPEDEPEDPGNKDNIVFADPDFKTALLSSTIDGTENGGIIDADNDGEISTDEALRVTHIDVTTTNIESLAEISFFTNLTYLSCCGALVSGSTYDGALSTLDVSKNTALETLLCYGNKLTTLDVSTTNLHHSEAAAPLDCSPMDVDGHNVLISLTLANDQVIHYINGETTFARNNNCLPQKTVLVEGSESTMFVLYEDTISTGATGGTISVSVITGTTYNINSLPSWITEIESPGTKAVNTTTHYFTVSPNTGTERIGVIVFCTDSMQCFPVTVTQAG